MRLPNERIEAATRDRKAMFRFLRAIGLPAHQQKVSFEETVWTYASNGKLSGAPLFDNNGNLPIDNPVVQSSPDYEDRVIVWCETLYARQRYAYELEIVGAR